MTIKVTKETTVEINIYQTIDINSDQLGIIEINSTEDDKYFSAILKVANEDNHPYKGIDREEIEIELTRKDLLELANAIIDNYS